MPILRRTIKKNQTAKIDIAKNADIDFAELNLFQKSGNSFADSAKIDICSAPPLGYSKYEFENDIESLI
ncbi:MAG: hypothetical protein U9O87_07175 [Verrucomicrobiota bacterium]|nr:hypothetical protein [Verrucomicrobiota bacterium]